MDYPRFLSNNLLLVLICLVALGLAVNPALAQWGKPPNPPPPPAPPRCQQDNMARPIGTRFLFSGNEQHYAQVLLDRADGRFARVLSDGVFVRDRFDAGSVGPIVFHPDGLSFAFIAAQGGQKYVLAYATGGETPYAAEHIEDAWNNWVCFGATGKYLFVIAKHNRQWHLDVRPEQAQAHFVRYPLQGSPAGLELLSARADGSEGFEYALVDGPMQMEIKSWFK